MNLVQCFTFTVLYNVQENMNSKSRINGSGFMGSNLTSEISGYTKAEKERPAKFHSYKIKNTNSANEISVNTVVSL